MSADPRGTALQGEGCDDGAGGAHQSLHSFGIHPQPQGLEFIDYALRRWSQGSGTTTAYIDPLSPRQNVFAESFNGRLKTSSLIPSCSPRWLRLMIWLTAGVGSTTPSGSIRPFWCNPPGGTSNCCCTITHSHCAWSNESGLSQFLSRNLFRLIQFNLLVSRESQIRCRNDSCSYELRALQSKKPEADCK